MTANRRRRTRRGWSRTPSVRGRCSCRSTSSFTRSAPRPWPISSAQRGTAATTRGGGSRSSSPRPAATTRSRTRWVAADAFLLVARIAVALRRCVVSRRHPLGVGRAFFSFSLLIRSRASKILVMVCVCVCVLSTPQMLAVYRDIAIRADANGSSTKELLVERCFPLLRADNGSGDDRLISETSAAAPTGTARGLRERTVEPTSAPAMRAAPIHHRNRNYRESAVCIDKKASWVHRHRSRRANAKENSRTQSSRGSGHGFRQFCDQPWAGVQ